MNWMEIKNLLVTTTGIPKDGLHILAGVAIILAAALLSRKSLGDWLPLGCAVALTAANEIYDWEMAKPWEVLADANRAGLIKDVVLTLLVPVLIFVALRIPRLHFLFEPRSLGTHGKDRRSQ